MSRIGKQQIVIPDNVDIIIDKFLIIIKGSKGELKLKLPAKVQIENKNNKITVSVKKPELKEQKALWGTYQRLITNNIIGVTEGFTKCLVLSGVGYRAEISGKNLVMELGFSHKIEYSIPTGIDITVKKNIITISGIDKQKVGQSAAEIRNFKKPEPYKGKGIAYENEIIRRKQGKQAAGATTA